ncbi:hypothetical protein DH2020_032037 [Rehmannia glutinosa]|uniref:RNA helicase n=1 Tax=Rehmannia glutinosa TaxID=99300 RepID=A0ABR0VJP4_REHGL
MKDRSPSSYGALYVPPHHRVRPVITAASANTDINVTTCSDADKQSSFSSPAVDSNCNSDTLNSYPYLPPHHYQKQLQPQKENLRHDMVAKQGSDRGFEFSAQPCASSSENIMAWKWKLNTLLCNGDKQELVSREKKDRRDFEQIAALASRMGLYSHLYTKVVVVSKVPLPNYRFDLDDKRPLREVILHPGLQKRVDAYLADYISGKHKSMDLFSRSNSTASIATDESLFEQPEPLPRSKAVMEKILWQRSLQMRDEQHTRQDISRKWFLSEIYEESFHSFDGIARRKKMMDFRSSLPAYKEKDSILSSISQNQVVIISGETGCGKTTQIPQFILESEIDSMRGAMCNIICTQPRRISAISVSERIATERGEKIGEMVGYKVRLEDFLLIVLKDLLPRRPELRLILMSATLDAELFSSYFGGAPMVQIPVGSVSLQGFTYPVRTHFLENILETTGYQLTTCNQIDDYGMEKTWKMSKQASRKRKSQIASAVEDTLSAADFKDFAAQTRESLSYWNPDCLNFNLIEYLLCKICESERPGAVLVFMTGWDDITSLKDKLQAHPVLGDTSQVLLLACHGSMGSAEQVIEILLDCLSFFISLLNLICSSHVYLDHYGCSNFVFSMHKLIFDKPEDGARKIVLATNIAETSITIDDVVFVIDCGKAKETSYDALNNTPCLLPSWISKVSAKQRRGRAGRVQPGECYHLYPRCVYDAFADYQLPEILRTPLQSLCLQIKSLNLGGISEFLSRALQSPEYLAVQNAIEYLKIIGALDENENLTVLGSYLTMLPMEPKLGKMLILGVIFNCLDPILSIVAGLSVRDPFLAPLDKKDGQRPSNELWDIALLDIETWSRQICVLAEAAKAQFSRDYSDHLALVRAFEGWKVADRDLAAHEYCWKNFLSAQSMKAIDSLRKEFYSLLKDIGLVDSNPTTYSVWSYDEHLVRAIICYGLYPGICSVVHNEKSFSLKTMEDGHVLLYSNSVNARHSRIPYPWLVFNEKIKVNSVFLRDSTAVSDSMLLLFGGSILRGDSDGHLKMLGGYLEFYMDPAIAELYQSLRRELDELIQTKVLLPSNQCTAAIAAAPQKPALIYNTESGPGGDNSKSQLQTLLTRAGYASPSYKTKQLKNNQFRSTVEFNGNQIMGQPCSNKKQAEKDAAAEALQWLLGRNGVGNNYEANSVKLSIPGTLGKIMVKEIESDCEFETAWEGMLLPVRNSH